MKTKRRNVKKPKRVAPLPPRTPADPAYTTLVVRPVDGCASLRTDDGGLTWRQVEFPDPHPNRPVGVTVLGISGSKGGAGGGGGRAVEIGKWRGDEIRNA